jgi:hypothetical protein
MENRRHIETFPNKKNYRTEGGCMKAVLLLGACFLLLSIAPVNAGAQNEIKRGDNWVLYSERENYSFYYDKTNIQQQSNKHIRVWMREETKDVATEVKGKRDEGLPPNGHEIFSYSLVLSEIDCSNKQIGDVSVTDYDNKGNVLKLFEFKDVGMRPVKPNTIAESLYKAVCKAEKM